MASNSGVKGLLVELFCDMENILLNLHQNNSKCYASDTLQEQWRDEKFP